MNPNEKQVGGSHYAEGGSLQHWDFVIRDLHNRYLEGNITKYVARHRKKNGVQDLEKALHYLEKLRHEFSLGNMGSMRDVRMTRPLWVSMFVQQNNLNILEANVMRIIAEWGSEGHLRMIEDLIVVLRDRAKKDDLERQGIKAGARVHWDPEAPGGVGLVVGQEHAEPGEGYVNQDR